MSDADRFKFHGDDHYLKSAAEMRELFREVPEACDNTLWIAERANVEIEFGKAAAARLPAARGLRRRGRLPRSTSPSRARSSGGATQLPDAVVERLAFELKVIGDMGFSSYFLIVWDLIRHARDHDIRVGPGRGSAAGCAVAYCLRITDLDPIRYDLLFERFLNPSRVSMPDIDMDFDSRYRDEMIRYAAEKLRPRPRRPDRHLLHHQGPGRGAGRRPGARLRLPDRPQDLQGDAAADHGPRHAAAGLPREGGEVRGRLQDGRRAAADVPRGPRRPAGDGRRQGPRGPAPPGRHPRRRGGDHPATRSPSTCRSSASPGPNQDPETVPVVTQYEMGGVEDLGLLKMDFLGLRNLDVITDALEIIKEFRGVDLDIDDDPARRREDPRPAEAGRLDGRVPARGRADAGAHALAGARLASRTSPPSSPCTARGRWRANMHTDYADRKNGRKPVEYFHPDAEEVLADT